MQAQPQSNLASRIPARPALPLPPITTPIATQPAPLSAPLIADTTGLAHDAGNFLAALGLYSELLSRPGVLRPEHKHYATELRLISNRSAELIRRLLSAPDWFIQSAAPLPEDKPLRQAPLFRRRNARTPDTLLNTPNHAATLLNLAPVLERIAAGAANVTVICPPTLPLLNFPSEIIERITVNLVRNAAEAIRLQQAEALSIPTASPGHIQVTLTVIDGRLQLTVQDNGPGMTPTNVEAYLNPKPLELGANHGFGHHIVHELATASDGQLSIQVLAGHGTTFCLKWPIPAVQPIKPSSSDVPTSLSLPQSTSEGPTT
jgi:signal transduction histidine kinase